MRVPYTKSGKCGDIVWQRNPYAQICYKYFIPANPRTPAQRIVRGSFGSVSKRWRTLSEEQRLSWCVAGQSKKTRRRLGQCWPLPGFNYFMRVNVYLVNRGQAQLDLPPADDPQSMASGPTLSQMLSLQARNLLPESPQAPPEITGRAPPPSG